MYALSPICSIARNHLPPKMSTTVNRNCAPYSTACKHQVWIGMQDYPLRNRLRKKLGTSVSPIPNLMQRQLTTKPLSFLLRSMGFIKSCSKSARQRSCAQNAASVQLIRSCAWRDCQGRALSQGQPPSFMASCIHWSTTYKIMQVKQ